MPGGNEAFELMHMASDHSVLQLLEQSGGSLNQAHLLTPQVNSHRFWTKKIFFLLAVVMP